MNNPLVLLFFCLGLIPKQFIVPYQIHIDLSSCNNLNINVQPHIFWILVLLKFSHTKIKILVQVCKSISIISHLTNTHKNVRMLNPLSTLPWKMWFKQNNNHQQHDNWPWSHVKHSHWLLFVRSKFHHHEAQGAFHHIFLSAFFHVCREIKNYWQMEKETTCLAQRESWWWQLGEVVSPWSFGGTCSNFGRWKVHAWRWQGGACWKFVKRERELGYEHMFLDYFATSPMYGEELFRHWYMMSCQILMRTL